jgi:hypothetical protein
LRADTHDSHKSRQGARFDRRIDPVRFRSVLLNTVNIFSHFIIVVALSASTRSFAAEQSSVIPAWLRAHVGEGEGQIAGYPELQTYRCERCHHNVETIELKVDDFYPRRNHHGDRS